MWDCINRFQDEVNDYQGNNNPCANGYIAELWHKYTFDLDALSKRTGDITNIPPTTFASVDIQGSWGEGYSLKYCKDAWHSAKHQATTYRERYMSYNNNLVKNGHEPITIEEYLRTKGIDENIDINLPIYQAQTRLIPADQLQDAIAELKWRIARDSSNPDRANLIERYEDTLKKLTDHVESPAGAKSLPLTEDESKVLQSLAKRGKFDPARYDITLAKKADYIFLAKSTFEAGLNSAIYSAVFRSLPSILTAISNLIKEGKITNEQLQDLVHEGCKGATQGFLQGFSTALIKNSCKLGFFGEDLKKLAVAQNPEFNNVVVVMVTTTIETMKDAIRLNNGEIEGTVFAQRLEKRVFIASFGYMCGTVSQTVLPFAPMVGYMIGSFMGTIMGGFAFEAKEKVFMSICVEHGFTCFGLVEQDYELPTSVKAYLGIESMNIDTMTSEEVEEEQMSYETMSMEKMTFEKMDIKWAKRGVIGIRKVGYVIDE